MKDETRREETIHDYFEAQELPDQIHAAIVKTCGELPEKARRGRSGWKATFAACGTVAALFVGFCCTNAINPALAESIPLVGGAFRQYNQDKKISVGTHIGTYGGVSEVNAPALGTDTAGLGLTAQEAYCDSEYVHLSFTLDAPEEYLEKYDYISLPAEIEVNGKAQEKQEYLNLWPSGDKFEGTMAVRLDSPVSDGAEVSLRYEIAEVQGCYNDGGDFEDLPGSFSGSVRMTADASHNRTIENFGGSGEIRILEVEATPSYTKIAYEIPFLGIGGWVADYPRLYTLSGEPIRGSLTEDVVNVSPSDIPRDAETLTSAHLFDGLPNGTEKVILRFLDEDAGEDMMYYPSAEDGSFTSKKARVMGEATIDLSTGEAVPSETYRDQGLSGPAGYWEDFHSLEWSIAFDDLFLRNDVHQMSRDEVFQTEDEFQNGFTLSGLEYEKEENDLAAMFYTTREYEKDLPVTVTKDDGTVVSKGTLSQEHWHDNELRMYYDSEEELLAEQDRQLEEAYRTDGFTEEEKADYLKKMEQEKAAVREEIKESVPGQHYCRAVMTPLPGAEPKLLDSLTVRVTDPDSGATLYERTVRFVRKQIA